MSIQFDAVKESEVVVNPEVPASAKAMMMASAIAGGVVSTSGDIAKTATGVAIGIALADLVASLF